MVKVLDFYADWCGPCKTQEPILEQVDEDYEQVELVKYDVDEKQDVANKYQVRSIPTIIVETDDEEVVQRFVGVTQREEIVEAIEDVE